MKLLFLKQHEIEETIEKELNIFQTCEISFNETANKEQILIKEEDEVQNKLSMESIFPILSREYNVKILSYDVYEVGYFGDGFAFSIM